MGVFKRRGEGKVCGGEEEQGAIWSDIALERKRRQRERVWLDDSRARFRNARAKGRVGREGHSHPPPPYPPPPPPPVRWLAMLTRTRRPSVQAEAKVSAELTVENSKGGGLPCECKVPTTTRQARAMSNRRDVAVAFTDLRRERRKKVIRDSRTGQTLKGNMHKREKWENRESGNARASHGGR